MYVGEFTHVTTFLKGNCGTVFLNAVIKETLWLHPLGPLLPREVQQQCEIGGFLIPENTPMIVNVYQIMRDPTVWEEQFMFAPERFLVSPEPDKINKCLFFRKWQTCGPSSRYRYSGNCSSCYGAYIWLEQWRRRRHGWAPRRRHP